MNSLNQRNMRSEPEQQTDEQTFIKDDSLWCSRTGEHQCSALLCLVFIIILLILKIYTDREKRGWGPDRRQDQSILVAEPHFIVMQWFQPGTVVAWRVSVFSLWVCLIEGEDDKMNGRILWINCTGCCRIGLKWWHHSIFIRVERPLVLSLDNRQLRYLDVETAKFCCSCFPEHTNNSCSGHSHMMTTTWIKTQCWLDIEYMILEPHWSQTPLSLTSRSSSRSTWSCSSSGTWLLCGLPRSPGSRSRESSGPSL